MVRYQLSNLSTVELRNGLGVRAVGRDVDISVNVVFADSLDNSLGTLDVHILQREVPGICLAFVLPDKSISCQRTWLGSRGRSG
jgi:hypothetical protein